MNIADKRVVVTGAAGGIGRELVLQLLAKKAAVLALDINYAALQELRQLCEDKGFDLEILKLDVTQKKDWKKLSDLWVAKKNIPDIWVNNAGISYPQLFEEISDELYDKIMDVNLNGVILGTRTAVALMKPVQKGVIVNVASLAGHLPSAFLSPYVTSKHGVVGLTRALQLEFQQRQLPIRLMLVSPSFADTAIMRTNNDFQFPALLKWCVSSAGEIAAEIIRGVENQAQEIYPGLSCKIFRRIYLSAPQSVYNLMTRFSTARNWKELIGLEGIRSRPS